MLDISINVKKFCEFCCGDGCIEDEFGEWKLEAVKIQPLPPVALSGERESQREADPYWSLFMKYIDEGYENGEKASFPIKYCPMCGRRLVDEVRRPLTPEEWVKRERARRQEPGYAEKAAKQAELFRALDELGKTIKKNADGSVEVPFTKWRRNAVKLVLLVIFIALTTVLCGLEAIEAKDVYIATSAMLAAEYIKTAIERRKKEP